MAPQLLARNIDVMETHSTVENPSHLHVKKDRAKLQRAFAMELAELDDLCDEQDKTTRFLEAVEVDSLELSEWRIPKT